MLGGTQPEHRSVTIDTKKHERTTLRDPTESHRLNRSLTPSTVLVIPPALHEHETIPIVLSTLEQNLHAVAAFHRKPSAKPGPAHELA